MGKNDAIRAALHETAARLSGVDDRVIAAGVAALVRGAALDVDAAPHRPALLRLAFFAHVFAPACSAGSLVMGVMQNALMALGESSAKDAVDDVRAVIDDADEDGRDLRLWLLVDEGMVRGFVGTRAQAAARAAELWALDDDTVVRLLEEGLPRTRS